MPEQSGDSNTAQPVLAFHTPEECWQAATTLMCPQRTHPSFEQRASLALYAAFRAAVVLQQPPMAFACALSRRGLREFCEELERVGDDEVSVTLRHFFGTSGQEFPWTQLEHDRFLTNSWLHLVVLLARWHPENPQLPIPA